jgi:hypothetical protein
MAVSVSGIGSGSISISSGDSVGEGLRVFFFNRPFYPATITRRVRRSRSNSLCPRLTQSPIQGLSVAPVCPLPYFRPSLIDGLGARLVALRNRLVHAYFDLDLPLLWN